MSLTGIHRGFLKKYGGFLFKQWKEKFLYLSLDGNLLICRDADSPPDLEIGLHSSCEAILEGTEISDLPRLPLGAQKDCCLALTLRDGKYLLLLASDRQECSQWLNMLRKVKESTVPRSPLRSCRHHFSSSLQGWREGGSPKHDSFCQEEERTSRSKIGKRSASCLRHGRDSHHAMKAVCLLMGGAAAGHSLGYMVTLATSAGNSLETPPPDFKDLGYHPSTCSQEADSPHFDSFEYESADQDFDSFDYGAFSF
ncbi:uncharacterized protein si:ch1073-83n3.2 [Erpetoichthys calabaricus]|uniref:uncharacterized protein si:ch1073-83n3.2 n=1 Tax=Erpetoichthys calabaricus TaxID=27687 RepID=UPI0022347890|nr:uncharacterized protein si:ch1073-83n3.2 [Erpetoichthys calabaricus]